MNKEKRLIVKRVGKQNRQDKEYRLQEKKKMKNFFYDAKLPAIKREGYIVKTNISNGYFVLHKNTYQIIIKLNKSGDYKTLDAVVDYLSLRQQYSGVEYKLIKKRKKDLAENQHVIKISAKGLLPRDIRSIFFHVAKVTHIHSIRIELKCFPKPHVLSKKTTEALENDGYTIIPPTTNSYYTAEAKEYLFVIRENIYEISAYRMKRRFFSWGYNLEISYNDIVQENDIDDTVIEMYHQLTEFPYCSLCDLKPVAKVLKRKPNTIARPHGIILKPFHNINCANSAKGEALKMIKENSYILHSELMKLYSYNPKPKAASKMANQFATRHNLNMIKITDKKAWEFSKPSN